MKVYLSITNWNWFNQIGGCKIQFVEQAGNLARSKIILQSLGGILLFQKNISLFSKNHNAF